MTRPILKSRLMILLAGCAGLTFSAPASAQPGSCAEAVSTAEMNMCADQSYQAADAALNDAYGVALKYVRSRHLEKPYDTKSFEDALMRAERAWVAFRDADCKDLTSQEWAGGTGTTSAILECMLDKTVVRTKELKARFAAK